MVPVTCPAPAVELCLLGFSVSWVRRLVFNLVPCSSSRACGFPQHVLLQVTLRGLRNLSGSSCLSCSCGGAMYVGFAVSLVRRLVFNLVPCSSSGACGFAQLPCRRLPFGVSTFSDTVCLTYCSAGGVGWRQPFPCVISASSAPDGLQGFAGFCTLCQGAPIGVVTALWVAVWWCLLALLASRALLVVLSSPPTVLDLCGGCALFSACFPLP